MTTTTNTPTFSRFLECDDADALRVAADAVIGAYYAFNRAGGVFAGEEQAYGHARRAAEEVCPFAVEWLDQTGEHIFRHYANPLDVALSDVFGRRTDLRVVAQDAPAPAGAPDVVINGARVWIDHRGGFVIESQPASQRGIVVELDPDGDPINPQSYALGVLAWELEELAFVCFRARD